MHPIRILATLATLITAGILAAPAPAQAGTPAYWTHARCGTAGTVSVGWQKSGTLRRPTQVRYDVNRPVYRLYAYYYASGVNTLRATVSFAEPRSYRGGHNWDRLGWYQPASGMRVLVRPTGNGYWICEANVRP